LYLSLEGEAMVGGTEFPTRIVAILKRPKMSYGQPGKLALLNGWRGNGSIYDLRFTFF
jgi:hypothetical protein